MKKITVAENQQEKVSTRFVLAKKCFGAKPSDETNLETMKKKLYDSGYLTTRVTVFGIMCKMTGIWTFAKVGEFMNYDINDIIKFVEEDSDFRMFDMATA